MSLQESESQNADESALTEPEALLLDPVQAVEAADNWAKLRHQIGAIAEKQNEWAGIPIPLDGEQLVINKKYAFAELFQGDFSTEEEKAKKAAAEAADTDPLIEVINVFQCHRQRCFVHIYREVGSKKVSCFVTGLHALETVFRTAACSAVWGIAQEQNALKLLGTLLPHHAFKSYLLTGMFVESSKRSGVRYVFRRLRPTIALREQGERLRILCAMCMHPMAYYDGTWAGAMCPTDDVVAHLMMMRGDERMFWRRCNQHGAESPLAGL